MDFKIADRMEEINASGIRRMFELAKTMKNPIDFSLGQPDFSVANNIKEKAIEAIREDKNGYSLSAGIPELRSKISQTLLNEGIHDTKVMAVSGASGGLFLALMATVNPGDEVLTTDPGFVAYEHLIKLAGGIPRYINIYPDFKLTPEKLKIAAGKNTRVLIFNTPANPTGVTYTEQELKSLAEEAKKLGLLVISDEVYDQFIYDHEHSSYLKFDSNAILIRAFSKSWGMPGWRAGFAAGPKPIIEKMITLQQFTYVCVPTPLQWGAVEALSTSVKAQVDEYRKRRDYVYGRLKDYFEVEKPGGAFYIFPKAPNGDGDTFQKKCIEKELLVVPGAAFSKVNTHFRISYATPMKILEKGLDILIDLAK
jgi:aspartate/methionine/tyrosine aminotransferase